MPICPIVDFSSITGAYKSDVPLIGAVDGHNIYFYVPDTYREDSLSIFLNGQNLHEGASNDFVKQESAGPGTGFNEVVFNRPPHHGDLVTASYEKVTT